MTNKQGLQNYEVLRAHADALAVLGDLGEDLGVSDADGDGANGWQHTDLPPDATYIDVPPVGMRTVSGREWRNALDADEDGA